MEKEHKRGLQLMGKISCVVAIPMIAIVVIGCIIGINGMNDVSDILMKEELHAASYSFMNTMNTLSTEDFRYDNGILYKGGVDITGNQSILDEFKENTGVDVSVIVEDVRRATTMTDALGNSLKDQPISAEVYEKLQQGEDVYDDNLTIGSAKYFVFYTPLKSSDGSIYGSLFVGYNQHAVSAMMKSSMTKMIATLCILAVLALAVVIVLIRSIGSVLTKTVGHLEEVADGSLNVTVHDKMMQRSDELGEVSRSLQKLVNSFTSIVGNIMSSASELDRFSGEFKNSFHNIKDSIDNINIAVDEIAHGATQQAGDTQQANEEVIAMGEAIDATAGNIITLSDSARKMSDYNQSADAVLKELLEISRRTNESVDEVQKQTDDTNQSAIEIQEATELIANIASQTNLLSLNASIEAARAGEQGKGFAVVATEIRTLADQCRESADKIAHVVNELIENSNQSVHTMNEVMDSIGEQNKKLENTLAMFGELNEEIGIVSQAISEISVEVDGLGVTKNEVLEQLESLSAIAQENAASTEETSASMVELSDIVEECTANTNGLVHLSEKLRENTTLFTIDAIKEEIKP